jgi:hypothetical protein
MKQEYSQKQSNDQQKTCIIRRRRRRRRRTLHSSGLSDYTVDYCIMIRLLLFTVQQQGIR